MGEMEQQAPPCCSGWGLMRHSTGLCLRRPLRATGCFIWTHARPTGRWRHPPSSLRLPVCRDEGARERSQRHIQGECVCVCV